MWILVLSSILSLDAFFLTYVVLVPICSLALPAVLR